MDITTTLTVPIPEEVLAALVNKRVDEILSAREDLKPYKPLWVGFEYISEVLSIRPGKKRSHKWVMKHSISIDEAPDGIKGFVRFSRQNSRVIAFHLPDAEALMNIQPKHKIANK